VLQYNIVTNHEFTSPESPWGQAITCKLCNTCHYISYQYLGMWCSMTMWQNDSDFHCLCVFRYTSLFNAISLYSWFWGRFYRLIGSDSSCKYRGRHVADNKCWWDWVDCTEQVELQLCEIRCTKWKWINTLMRNIIKVLLAQVSTLNFLPVSASGWTSHKPD